MVLILSIYDSVSNQLDIEWVDWNLQESLIKDIRHMSKYATA